MAMAQYSRGINLSGAEFGQSHLPGKFNSDYTFQSESSFRYFAGRNLDLIRFPLQWERLQPSLRGPLDPAYLALLKQAIDWSRAHGGKFIVEIHNFARYSFNENSQLNTYVIDNPVSGVIRVSGADLADLWLRLSAEFKDDPGVYAYDIMNEPHDMGPANWKTISQAVLNAIRANGDSKLVMIPGDSWSSASRWILTHGPQSWITDPADHFVYEAHEYFDSDESGTYALSYDAELKRNTNLANIGTVRLAPFVSWCQANNVRGFLGEYGVPNTDSRWLTVLENLLQALDQAGFDGTYWAAGEWWNNYALSVQPQNSFTIDRVQMGVLSGHLSPGAFTSVSAASYGSASGSAASAAPDSLASGFGLNLAQAAEIDIIDAAGQGTAVLPLFVSPSQINYAVPANLGPGHYRVEVRSGGAVIAQGNLELDALAPALFTSDGKTAAAQLVRVYPDGSQTIESVNGAIDLGDPADRVFLVIYGTGFRSLSGLTGASLQLGVAYGQVTYAGAQGTFTGLDQINAEVPRSLAGAGEVAVLLTVDGRAAKPVTLTFR